MVRVASGTFKKERCDQDPWFSIRVATRKVAQGEHAGGGGSSHALGLDTEGKAFILLEGIRNGG